jgi:hypothetical protein
VARREMSVVLDTVAEVESADHIRPSAGWMLGLRLDLTFVSARLQSSGYVRASELISKERSDW